MSSYHQIPGSYDNLMNSLHQYSDTPLDTRRDLIFAPEGQQFILHDGTQLYSLRDLRNALETMTQELYDYHVTNDHNDFANWIEGALQDGSCAHALRRCRKPLSAKRILIKYLKNYR